MFLMVWAGKNEEEVLFLIKRACHISFLQILRRRALEFYIKLIIFKMNVSTGWAIPRRRLLLLMLRSLALKLELLLKLFNHEARPTNSSYCFTLAP